MCVVDFGMIVEINKVSSSKTITLNNNFDITSILVKLRKGYGASIKIDLTNTPYQINDSKIYETTINTLVADEVSLEATIPEKQITITHSGSVTNYGEYEVIYYTPVKTGNHITDYTQNVVKYSAVVAGNNVFTTTADADIVLGYSNNDYVLTSVKVGGKSVTIENGSATVTTLFNSDLFSTLIDITKKEEEINPEQEKMFGFFEEKMKNILGSKVTIKRNKKNKGRIEIEYYSTDELERLIDLIQSIKNE